MALAFNASAMDCCQTTSKALKSTWYQVFGITAKTALGLSCFGAVAVSYPLVSTMEERIVDGIQKKLHLFDHNAGKDAMRYAKKFANGGDSLVDKTIADGVVLMAATTLCGGILLKSAWNDARKLCKGKRYPDIEDGEGEYLINN